MKVEADTRPKERREASGEERCLRCAATMEWRHGTWQCPRCRFKVGCCEGPTAECFSE